MRRGVDYSWARPGGAALKAAGYSFAVRYVPYVGDQGKGLTTGELADLRANGIAVALVFEQVAERPLQGRRAGLDDAATSVRALEALGLPATMPVYFAVDFDAQGGQFDVIDDYFRAVNEVIGKSRTGVYGGYDTLARCRAMGTASYFWQALAWNRGRTFEGRHLYQSGQGTVNGGEVDFNESYAADFGQWPREEASVPDVELRREVDELKRALFAGPGSGHQGDADGGLGYANYRIGLRVKPQKEPEQPATGLESMVVNVALGVAELARAVRDPNTTAARLAEIEARLEQAAKALLSGGTK